MTRPHGYARYRLDGCHCYTCGWTVAHYNDAREHAMQCLRTAPLPEAVGGTSQESGLSLRNPT